jgi:hypothetical protein
MMRLVQYIAIAIFCLLPIVAYAQTIVIEDFDSGTILLDSWSDEDIQPDAWTLDSGNTFAGSAYSLKLSGNTWKEQEISPFMAQSSTVIEFAAYHNYGATVQGIGFSDGLHHLFYSISGSRILDLEEWIPVYQGAQGTNSWNQYQLPLGADWESFFEYSPQISSIIYINDLDNSSSRSVWFDSILNISQDLAVAPEVSITAEIPVSSGKRFVGLQFSADITDPDSSEFSYLWSFGDGNNSEQSSPYHVYDLADDHDYSVNLMVTDESGKIGLAATQITLDMGSSTLPLSLNFVGDVMLARRYDMQVIPYFGIESIFNPTLPLLGGAADVTMANLEVVLADTGSPHPTKSVVYRGNPANVAGLVFAGIDNVSLANNHTLDYGLPALQQTQDLLQSNNISFSGAGENSYEAYKPSFINQKGISIALLRSSDRTGQYNNAQPYLHAGFSKPGFAYMTPYYNMMQLQAVEGIADLKVIEMHAGSEYSLEPGSDYGKNMPWDDYDQDEDYSYRYDVPHQWDRDIRHSAIDNGADLVIVHHPHIVHGLELYNGKVIAHSLGNFAFDLDYPECMNSVIFYVDAYPDGFRNHHVRPVYIDSYIPKPALGQLGIHILDYIAMKSRDLDTIVVVDKEALKAYVPTQTELLHQTLHPFEKNLLFDTVEDGMQQSAPIKLPRFGSISSVDYLGPADDADLRLGRELIWYGNFEDEGSGLWDIPQFSTAALDGERAAFLEGSGGEEITATVSKKLKLNNPEMAYTLHGWLRTRNTADANISIRYFSSRTSYYPLSTEDICSGLSGNNSWDFYYKELEPPASAQYFDIRLSFTAGATGQSQAWFDNVGLIQWNPWLPRLQLQELMYPNDYYWFQVRSSEAVKSLNCRITETAFALPNPRRSRHTISAELPVNIYPNPFNPDTTISFELSKAAPTSVKIYNLKGQLVATVLDAEMAAGKHNISWKGKDYRGKNVASGLYLIRVQSGQHCSTRKAILMK